MLGIYCRTSKDSETSIEQQRKLGIQFSISQNFEYEVYEDEGISGFKISDDDIDPFNNRTAFTSLINDIKSGKLDKVWVYEHSRLSRNQYASAAIFNIFEKYNVELFENEKKLDLNDPQFQMMRQILDAVSQYERHLIVNRTTRGLYNAIDRGTRGYSRFYGYENVGKKEDGKTKWVPIHSKLNQIKFAYEKILKGVSMKRIALELYDNKEITKNELSSLRTALLTMLKHFEYTGHSFNYEGTVLYQKILKNEVENISALNDAKYFVKSVPYPIEIISINDWFTVFEKLVINYRVFKTQKEGSFKRASQGIATGIIECSECNFRFYNWFTSNPNKSMKYHYYKHHSAFNGKYCKQKPRSFRAEKIDEIFKLLYFFNCIVFNDNDTVIDESLFRIKQEITLVNERLNKINKNIETNKKQNLKFNKAIDSTEDVDSITVLAKRISKLEKKNEDYLKEKTSIIVELEKLNIKYSGTELEKIYYNVKDLVINFFNSNDEEKRSHLLKIIKKCYSFNHYLIIDTGKIVFLFDTRLEYVFENSLLENLNKDLIYKKYFIEGEIGTKVERVKSGKIYYALVNVNLNRDSKILKRTQEYLKDKLGINFDLKDKSNLISFTGARAFWSIERTKLS